MKKRLERAHRARRMRTDDNLRAPAIAKVLHCSRASVYVLKLVFNNPRRMSGQKVVDFCVK
jgi:hypothetical protein